MDVLIETGAATTNPDEDITGAVATRIDKKFFLGVYLFLKNEFFS